MEPHGATLYTSNSTGAVWRPFKLSLEMDGATLSTSNTTGAVWRPFKLNIEMHGAPWNRMEPPYKLQILQESHGDPLNEV